MATVDLILAVMPIAAAMCCAALSAYFVAGHKHRRLDGPLAVFFMILGLSLFWLFFTEVAIQLGVPQIAERMPRAFVFRGALFIAVFGLLIRIVMNGEQT